MVFVRAISISGIVETRRPDPSPARGGFSAGPRLSARRSRPRHPRTCSLVTRKQEIRREQEDARVFLLFWDDPLFWDEKEGPEKRHAKRGPPGEPDDPLYKGGASCCVRSR